MNKSIFKIGKFESQILDLEITFEIVNFEKGYVIKNIFKIDKFGIYFRIEIGFQIFLF